VDDTDMMKFYPWGFLCLCIKSAYMLQVSGYCKYNTIF